MEQKNNYRVIAEKSSSIGGFLVLIVLLLAGSVVGIVFVFPSNYFILILLLAILLLAVTLYYLIMLIILPKTMAIFQNGELIFYPRKGVVIKLKPDEICFIREKRSSSQYFAYSFGKLVIEISQQREPIVLRNVAEVEATRRVIESIINNYNLK